MYVGICAWECSYGRCTGVQRCEQRYEGEDLYMVCFQIRRDVVSVERTWSTWRGRGQRGEGHGQRGEGHGQRGERGTWPTWRGTWRALRLTAAWERCHFFADEWRRVGVGKREARRGSETCVAGREQRTFCLVMARPPMPSLPIHSSIQSRINEIFNINLVVTHQPCLQTSRSVPCIIQHSTYIHRQDGTRHRSISPFITVHHRTSRARGSCIRPCTARLPNLHVHDISPRHGRQGARLCKSFLRIFAHPFPNEVMSWAWAARAP